MIYSLILPLFIQSLEPPLPSPGKGEAPPSSEGWEIVWSQRSEIPTQLLIHPRSIKAVKGQDEMFTVTVIKEQRIESKDGAKWRAFSNGWLVNCQNGTLGQEWNMRRYRNIGVISYLRGEPNFFKPKQDSPQDAVIKRVCQSK